MPSHPKVSKGRLIKFLQTQGIILVREDVPNYGRMWVVTNHLDQKQLFPSLVAVAAWITREQKTKEEAIYRKLHPRPSSDPVENNQSEPQEVPEGQNLLKGESND